MLSVILAATEAVAEKVAETDLVETVTENIEPVVEAAQSMSIWGNIMDSDFLIKFTLLILVGFSVACWAIIFLKIRQLKKAQSSSQSFWHLFSSSPNVSEVKIGQNMHGPLTEIYESAQNNLARVKKVTKSMTNYHRDFLHQRINEVKEEELHKLEQYVSFLATTASVAPFIGLFGTVWGILTAFMAIGTAGSTSLATVGPHIAEALVATAIGLFAAIPAVIAYNYFVNKIRYVSKLIDLFIADYILKTEKEFS